MNYANYEKLHFTVVLLTNSKFVEIIVEFLLICGGDCVCFVAVRYSSGCNLWESQWSTDLQKQIEEYWSKKPQDNRFDENSTKEKFYVLSMFPYPSGNIHMGHVRVYTIGDVIARYQRLKGKNVLHPIGWDAFGLPAENAAIDRNVDPEKWTQENIENMKSVLEKLNLSFDWNREFATCDSDYYKWTQYLFLKLYEQNLVYRKEGYVNWDPVDQTVLADEQVDEEGLSWRSGAPVEKKLLTQWFIRTTRYWRNLVDGLDDPVLVDWSDIKKLQAEWLGTCSGTTIDFAVVENESDLQHKFMTVWIEKPEYIHKVKYIAVDPDSVWNSGTVVSGVLPYKVKNLLTGEVLPVYATRLFNHSKVTENYPAMPEIFESDRVYAQSVNLSYKASADIIATEEELLRHREDVCEDARKLGVGGYETGNICRDWLISRQRYWGTPIPIVYCQNCGPQPVPEKELPVKLPKIKKVKRGKNPLLDEKDWLKATCPKCGGEATRETDTMDTFVDSSWYFLRFIDPDNLKEPFTVDKAMRFMPVDMYIGGKEHATLHLYYARFLNHFLYSVGLLPQKEPFSRLLLQGIVRGKTYQRKSSGEYVHPNLVRLDGESAFHAETGEELLVDWQKMSKSKHNGVEPLDLLDRYGVDTTRLVILADVGPKTPRNWCENTFSGVLSWQKRVWNLVVRFRKARQEDRKTAPTDLDKIEARFFDSRNYAVDMVDYSLGRALNMAVAISKMQTLTNNLNKDWSEEVAAFSVQYERALAAQIILLAPLAPSFASELWSGFVSVPYRLVDTEEIQWDKPVFQQSWPKMDADYKSKLQGERVSLKQQYDKARKLKLKQEKKSQPERMAKKVVS